MHGSNVTCMGATLDNPSAVCCDSLHSQRAVVGGDAVIYHRSSEVVAHIWRTERLGGFYRGILPHILRSTPQATITLLVYEYCQRGLETWRAQTARP